LSDASGKEVTLLYREDFVMVLEQCDRYEFIRKLSPQQFAALNERCTAQDLRFDDEVLRLARAWQEEKRIDL
jgi:hypothetical protein